MTTENVNNNNLCVLSYEQVKELVASIAAKGEKSVAVEGPSVPELLTEIEVRDLLGISHSTLWHWGKSGYLNSVKIGHKARWKKHDVYKLMGA